MALYHVTKAVAVFNPNCHGRPPRLIVDKLLIFAYKFFGLFLTYSGTPFIAYKTFVHSLIYLPKPPNITSLKLGGNQSFLYFRLSVILLFL